MKGAWKQSNIDLGNYETNRNGKVMYQKRGKYYKSCKDCSISQRLVLSCKCQDCKGKWKNSSVRVGSFIQNIDGKFKFGK